MLSLAVTFFYAYVDNLLDNIKLSMLYYVHDNLIQAHELSDV